MRWRLTVDTTGEASARILTGLIAGLRNQSDSELVAPYLQKIGEMLTELPEEERFGCYFIQAALPGLAHFPPCHTTESILIAIRDHLEMNLNPVEWNTDVPSKKPFFYGSAVLELMPHLEQQAGRDLALAIIRRTDPHAGLPRDGFNSPQKTDEWLRSRLSIGNSRENKLDLHGMSHRLAAHCVGAMIEHALSILPGKNSLEIVYGGSTHSRANEGVMRPVVEQVIQHKREAHGEKIGEVVPDVKDVLLRVVVQGQRLSSDGSHGAQRSASDTASPINSNSFAVLSGDTSGGSKSGKTRKKKQAVPADQVAARQSATTQRAAAALPPQKPPLGWIDYLRGWVGLAPRASDTSN